MSTLPGGAADKAGLVHEALWGVHAMLQVIYGQAESITIEEPGLDGAEFVLLKGGKREYWQAKRQVLNQENWSLQRLKSEGVLDFFLDRTHAGESCVFASISDAPELRVLAENARDAQNCETFCNKFLGGGRRDDFTNLRTHWNAIAEANAFSCLLLIRVEGARETTLESLLVCLLAATFTGPAQTAMAVLKQLYVTSVHQTLNAETIRKHLESHTIKPREFTLNAGLQDFLNGITDTYIAGQRAKLIRGHQIPRKAALDIVNQLTNSQESLDVLVTGPAGGGKSGCLLQVVEGLRQAGLTVLAFRLDRIEPVQSPEALGKQLDLPESPALVLTRAFKGKPVVLMVDQLDFVSTTSGRHPDFFDTIAALVSEIRGLRSFDRVHLVLACRQFDFEHDHRLRRLIVKEQQPIAVGSFSNQEVADVIKAEHGDPSRLSPSQLELLRLPQNLSLFIESQLAVEKAPGFVTQKELFDSYWEAKRRSVSAKRPNEAGQWMQIIERLAGEMNARQELSVPKASLDAFSPQFLDVMVSEGVLTFDNRCYGFGHESFFDYCFARIWSAGNRDFVAFLENDDQRLFRRAQLRQVLVYLRDADHSRFLKNVQQALASKQIRPHLKLLVLELLASFQNPHGDEFAVLLPYLESTLNCRRKKEPDTNRIAARVFDTFFASRSLFIAADKLGHIKNWLHSGEPWLEDLMANYLRWQVEEHANRVAELIEPFVGKEDWKPRLRFIMEWASKEKDRRFFDLFLRLIDDGTLDNARAPIASNGTFWSMFGHLAKCRPAWFAEVAAHWLDRRVAIALATTGAEQGLGFDDEFGVQDFFESARTAPREFLQHVVPAVIRAAQAFAYKGDTTLCHDGVWPDRYRGQHIGLKEAYLSCCETAIGIVGKSNPKSLEPIIAELLPLRLYTTNHLLLVVYLATPKHFAEDAITLLASDPDRLLCGYSDSAHWTSRCVIKKCSPYCADVIFQKLETSLLSYVTLYENSEAGAESRGYAAFNLASALDPNRLSHSTKQQLAEWQNKFGAPDGPPQDVRAYEVVSPVPRNKAEGFSDEDWLQAIAAHNMERGVPDWKHPGMGGASEFAALLHGFTEANPERFAQLALKFPDDTNPTYFMNVLYGLRGVPVASALKCEVARRVFSSSSGACLKAAIDILGQIQDMPLPDDAVLFIARMATEHPNLPKQHAQEYKKANDIVGEGINSVRGHAADAIRDLIRCDKNYLNAFADVLEKLVVDPNLGVRACVATTLTAVAAHDAASALTLFRKLVNSDDLLLATTSVQAFCRAGLSDHFADLRPLVSRMLVSNYDEVRQAGGILASLARLYHESAQDLAETAMNGDVACRLGVVKVANDNLLHPDCNEWCEPKLKLLFNDSEIKVRNEAARCFWHLWQQPDLPLTKFESLIDVFLDSPAFAEEPTFLLHALEDTRQRVPEAILDVCGEFMDKCAEQARDIRTSLAGDEHTVGKLVFRAYAQLESTALWKDALDLIDQMCEEGLQSAGKQFVEFER